MEDDWSQRKKRLARRFAEEADGYRGLWAPVLRSQGVVLLDALGIRTARRILDLGTGVGALLPDIHERAPDAFGVGVDISEGMLALAPPGSVVAAMDATRLAFTHEAFDVAVTAFVLQFLPDPADGLAEAWRVLRPGGRIGVATWGQDPGCPAFAVWSEELDALGAPRLDPIIANHSLVDTPDKVRRLLEGAGFASIRTWTGRIETRMDVETYLAHRTGHGESRRRFRTLADEAGARCLDRVRDRLVRLDPEDLVERERVVFATGLRLSEHRSVAVGWEGAANTRA